MQQPIATTDSKRLLFASIVKDFRFSWKALTLADLIYKGIAFVVLIPLAGVLFQIFIYASGDSVLTDQDILFFFLSPLGWVSILIIGAVSIGIIALEQAALITIAFEAARKRPISVFEALYFTAKYIWPVLRITGKMVITGILVTTPFLLLAGSVYFFLLTQYDINYYLSQTPKEFWVAATLIACCALIWVVLMIRLLSSWIFVLPLLLFEKATTKNILRESRYRTVDKLRPILLWIGSWVIALIALSTIGTAAVGTLGYLILPSIKESLVLLSLALGAIFILWTGATALVTLLTSTTFAVLLVNLYRRFGIQTHADPTASFQLKTPEIKKILRLSPRMLWTVALGVMVIIAVVNVNLLQSVQLEDHTEIMAHRGASAAAPENTLAAIRQAISDGADWVEVDVQETADGVVVLFHDSDFKKLAGIDLKIWNATSDQLKNIDVGSSFSTEFQKERVPTLNQALALCKEKIGVNIELKYYGHDERLEKRVIQSVESHGMESSILIMSLNRNVLQKFRSIRPGWKVGLLTAVAVGKLTRVDADFLAVNVKMATPRFVRSAHRRGKAVYVWTVNDPLTMSIMMGRGVDAIITDKPALARSILEQRRQMSSLERLLVEAGTLFGVRPKSNLTIDDF